jgi:hypothetical protein
LIVQSDITASSEKSVTFQCAHEFCFAGREISEHVMTERHEPLLEKWSRFRGRPLTDRKLILRAALTLPLTEIGLRTLGFRRWKKLIEWVAPPARPLPGWPTDQQRETALRTVRAVRSAELHGPASPNCLERSMTLWWMLRRAGVAGELHIGARKDGGKMEAHAWVELGGEVLNDGADVHQHYSRFDAPIAAGAGDTHGDGETHSDAGSKATL